STIGRNSDFYQRLDGRDQRPDSTDPAAGAFDRTKPGGAHCGRQPAAHGSAGTARTLRGAREPLRLGGRGGDGGEHRGGRGPLSSAIAMLLVVTFLDVVVAWALYVLLKPVDEALALLVGWLRLAAPAVFAVALANLLDIANL